MCVRCVGNRCDLIEVTAPNGFRLPLVAITWVYHASPLTRGRRDVRGRPREQLSSHTSRGSASLRHRCAVCTIADWARAWPATHAASCSAADGRRTASAGSGCIGSIMRAPSYASYHHRNQPSLEPILPRATRRGCFCGMLAAASTEPRRAALARMTSLADSDPKARSALHTQKGSNRPSSHQASPESANCTVCPSV